MENQNIVESNWYSGGGDISLAFDEKIKVLVNIFVVIKRRKTHRRRKKKYKHINFN